MKEPTTAETINTLHTRPIETERQTRRPPNYVELVEQNQRLRAKITNYRLSMKQLQRAHVVTLYQLESLQLTHSSVVFDIDELIAEKRALRQALNQANEQILSLKETRHKGMNGQA